MRAMTTAGNLSKGILIAFCFSFLIMTIEFIIIEQTVLAEFMIAGFIIAISFALCGYTKNKKDKKTQPNSK